MQLPPETFTVIVAIVEGCMFFAPVISLIWKAAKTAARLEQVEEKVDKLDTRTNDLDNATDMALSSIMASLNEIKIGMARLETRMDILTPNQEERHERKHRNEGK